MLRFLKSFFILDLQTTYFKPYFIIVELLTLYLTVLIYYYSSKAFIPSTDSTLNFYGGDLFTYLLWGDLVLKIPQQLFYTPVQQIKRSIQDNTFESMQLFTCGIKKLLLGLSTMQLAREIISFFLMLFIAMIFFDFDLTSSALFKTLIMMLIFLPIFLGVGLMISALVIYVEKGESFLYYIANIMAILAGVYFPVEVFPQSITQFARFLSPFYDYLRINREILMLKEISLINYLVPVLIGIPLLMIGLFVVEKIINIKKSQGKILIIS